MVYQKYGKRFLDFVFAVIILLLFCWLYALIAAAILLTDGRPVIFAQNRVGLNGKVFRVYKFRTMVKNAEAIGPKATAAGDPRITPIGRILRKTSLDELAQLFNILKGDMSFVGFRPGVPEAYNQQDYESGIFSVKPGITGYAQIHGRSSLTKEQKRSWELQYTRDISLKTDIKVLFSTVLVVLKREGTN